jgi:hypothetical protein
MHKCLPLCAALSCARRLQRHMQAGKLCTRRHSCTGMWMGADYQPTSCRSLWAMLQPCETQSSRRQWRSARLWRLSVGVKSARPCLPSSSTHQLVLQLEEVHGSTTRVLLRCLSLTTAGREVLHFYIFVFGLWHCLVLWWWRYRPEHSCNGWAHLRTESVPRQNSGPNCLVVQSPQCLMHAVNFGHHGRFGTTVLHSSHGGSRQEQTAVQHRREHGHRERQDA